MKKNRKPSFAKTNRALAREWHPTKNAPLTPRDVTAGSTKKVWWLCKKGHAWEASIYNRQGSGCPYCTGRLATKENCLQTSNPELAAEWHPAKNAPLTPKDVRAGSGKRVWWVCREGHEWKAVITTRVKGSACPDCRKQRKCLAVMKPELAREWHPTRNAPLTPKDVPAGSHTRRVVDVQGGS